MHWEGPWWVEPMIHLLFITTRRYQLSFRGCR